MAITTTSIELGWIAATDNIAVTDYKVYKSDDGITYDSGTSVGNVLSYVYPGLTPNTQYWFKITALDAALNESEFSNIKTDSTLAGAYTGAVYKASSDAGIRSSTSQGSSPFIPSSVTTGDILVSVCVSNNVAPQSSSGVPTGWTRLREQLASNMSYNICWKVADAGDVGGSSVLFTWGDAATNRQYSIMHLYEGATSVENIDGNATISSEGRQFTNSNTSSGASHLAVALYLL